jgi:hypothetical protein
MRGDARVQDSMFSYLTLEQRVPRDHPLRAIRVMTLIPVTGGSIVIADVSATDFSPRYHRDMFPHRS